MAAVQNKQLRTLAGLQETSRQGCPLAMGIELEIPSMSEQLLRDCVCT